jgi:hypothetical protein
LVTGDHLGGAPLRERLAPQTYDRLIAAFRSKVIDEAALNPRRAGDVPVAVYVERSSGRLLVRCGFTGSTFFLDWSGDASELDRLVANAAGEAAHLLRDERARHGPTGFE